MFPSLGMPEMIVIGMIAVILFGKRLPEVGRSLGKGIVEFKKGLRGLEDEFHGTSTSTPDRYEPPRSSPSYSSSSPEPSAADVPKFEPPSAAPVPRTDTNPQPYTD